METLFVLAAVVAVVVAADRLLLAAEARGWVYWRRTKGRRGYQVGAGIAGELGAILSPAERSRQEAVAYQEEMPEVREAAGGTPPR